MFNRVINILKANLNDALDNLDSKTISDIDKEYNKLFGTHTTSESTSEFDFDAFEREFEQYKEEEVKYEPSEKEYYDALELKPGASYAQVKAAYRRLIKEYHPDKFPNDPSKQKMALEVSGRLNRAYEYLERKLKK